MTTVSKSEAEAQRDAEDEAFRGQVSENQACQEMETLELCVCYINIYI